MLLELEPGERANAVVADPLARTRRMLDAVMGLVFQAKVELPGDPHSLVQHEVHFLESDYI